MGKKNRIRRQKSSDEEKPKCNPGDGGDKDEVDASTNNDRSSSNGEATGRKKDKRRGHQKLAKNNKKDQSSSDKEATLRKNDKDRGGGRRGTDKGKHMKAEKDGRSRRKGGDSPMDRPDQRSSDEEKPKCNPGDGGDKDEVDASTNNDRSSSNGEATGRKKDKRRGHQKLAKNNKKDQSSSDKQAELRKNDKDRGGGRRGTDKGKHMKAEKDGRSRRKGGDSPMDRPDQRASLDEESTIPQASPHRVPPSETVLALTGCKAAERTIQKLDITRMQMDVSVLHSFTLPANPTLQQIREFFAARLVYYQLKYPSSSIPGRLRNGICINIPVTPDKEAKLEDRCYHVVKFTRSTDLAVGQLLVEDYSCYVVAHRVIRCDEKEEDVPWNMIGDEDLPSRFKSPRRTKYGSHYISPSKIQIYVGTIDDIVSFLEEFKKKYNQVPTTEGKRYFDTIFVLVSEAFRFVVVGKWAERGLLSNVYVPIPTAFPSLLRDWLDLCKIIYLLYLALLEKALLGEEHPLFLATMNETVQKWKETQRQVLEARVIFFEEGVDLDLEQLYYLNGENILLLRYDEDLWKKISLRRIGYEGLWMEAINIKVLGS